MENEEISYGLEEIHKLLLEVLDEFDKICRQHDIHYSLHGGTLLGAERNHKLIPWDDDIDVSMTREEYEKLYSVMLDYNGEYQLDRLSMWFPRFLLKKGYEVAYIDILIWDYISEKKWQQFLKLNLLRAVQGMLKPFVDYSRFGIKNKLLLYSTHMIGKLFSQEHKIKIYHYLEKKSFLGKKQYIHRSNDAFKDIAYIFDKEYMAEYVDIELEGKMYMVTKRYHEFLIRSYGEDYMTPPPMSKRKPGHEMFKEVLKNI